jgi:hypothetical protein
MLLRFLGKGRELRLRLVEVVAGEQQAIDMLAIPREARSR